MHSRIYWLLPDVESARRTMDDLLLARIELSQDAFRRPGGLRHVRPARRQRAADVGRRPVGRGGPDHRRRGGGLGGRPGRGVLSDRRRQAAMGPGRRAGHRRRAFRHLGVDHDRRLHAEQAAGALRAADRAGADPADGRRAHVAMSRPSKRACGRCIRRRTSRAPNRTSLPSPERPGTTHLPHFPSVPRKQLASPLLPWKVGATQQ